ncbi:MAG: hypothetical protein ACRCYS_20115, partial [Beijerinckiaceae bacterium]
MAKEAGQWIIPSSYHQFDARSHEAQRREGSYWFLAADIDKGSPSLGQVQVAVGKILGEAAFLIYSSRSASLGNLKWRVLVPLAQALTGIEYGAYQAAWFDGLEHFGLQIDRTLERAGQLIYLPNRGEHYESHAQGQAFLDAARVPWASRAKQYLEAYEAVVSGGSAKQAEGQRSFLRAFRKKHSI